MHVDWLAASQYHGSLAREFVGSLTFRGDVGDDAAELVETAGGRQVEGSYASSLRVRSHGGWVSVSGNPARYGRPDNLFGFDLDDSVAVFNQVLSRLGLPAFTRGEELKPLETEIATGARSRWTGCAFSRIDLCENYTTGSELFARLAIRSYQARAAAYLKKHSFGEETALFHNTRRSVKAYRKGPDMAIHCSDSEWIDWANNTGLVRHEVALKSRLLSGTGLRYWGNLDMATLHHLFHAETELLRRPDSSLDPLALEAVPPRARLVYAAWLRGEDVRALVSRATLTRHRKTLREVASVDIAEPRSMGAVHPIVRVIDLAPAVAPHGYWLRAAA